MKRLALILIASFVALPLFAQSKMKTLAIDSVNVSPSVASLCKRTATHEACLARVQEGLDNALTTEIVNARKFTMVERSHLLESFSKEIALAEAGVVGSKAAEFGALIGAELILVADITSFTLVDTIAEFNGTPRGRLVCELSLQTKIVDVTKGEIIASSTTPVSKTIIVDLVHTTDNVFNHFDKIIPEITTEVARKTVQELIATAYPVKIIDVDLPIITLNRGSGFFVEGEIVQVMGASRKVTDPDTGAIYEIPGRAGGLAKIIFVDANIAQAELLDGAKAKVGARVIKK